MLKALSELDWVRKGIKINGKYLNNHTFPNGVMRVGLNREELTKIRNELIEEWVKIGLEINTENSKYMSNTQDNTDIIQI